MARLAAKRSRTLASDFSIALFIYALPVSQLYQEGGKADFPMKRSLL